MPSPLSAAPRPVRIALWAAGIAALAELLHLILGHGLVNYDSLYALLWGRDLGHGHLPDYRVSLAPTPHPLAILAGLVLAPFSSQASGPLHGGHATQLAVGGAFLALAIIGWLVYRLGREWFGTPAGVLAAAIVLTRQPILDYGSRVYVDIPYLALVLGAMLVETRRPRAGWPVLALLTLAGLVRPEAWAFAGLYWLWLAAPSLRGRHRLVDRLAGQAPARGTPELAWLALLALAAPLLWVGSDWAVTGDPLWSLTSTRHTAQTLDRVTGIGHVPEYIPRRIGEITRPPVLLGAAVGGVLSLWWLRERAALGAAVGVASVVVFAVLASAGLPINTRYAFLPATILCLFCGAGALGFLQLEAQDPRRRPWMIAGAVVVVALLAFVPGQRNLIRSLRHTLHQQDAIQHDLATLVSRGTLGRRCLPVAVPNHRPVPVLAIWLDTAPRDILSAQDQTRPIRAGTYLQPGNATVRSLYILDKRDPVKTIPRVPAGFALAGSNGSWQVYSSCRR